MGGGRGARLSEGAAENCKKKKKKARPPPSSLKIPGSVPSLDSLHPKGIAGKTGELILVDQPHLKKCSRKLFDSILC